MIFDECNSKNQEERIRPQGKGRMTGNLPANLSFKM